VVLEGLSSPLRLGTRVPITLQFDGGDPAVTLLLTVAKELSPNWCRLRS